MAITIHGEDTGYPMHRDTVTEKITFRCVAHGIDPSDCGTCADTERAAFMNSLTNRYPAYVSAKRRIVTTFGGHALGMILSSHEGRRRWTPTGGEYRMEYVTVRDANGGIWHGAHNSEWDLVILRRSRKAVR